MACSVWWWGGGLRESRSVCQNAASLYLKLAHLAGVADFMHPSNLWMRECTVRVGAPAWGLLPLQRSFFFFFPSGFSSLPKVRVRVSMVSAGEQLRLIRSSHSH